MTVEFPTFTDVFERAALPSGVDALPVPLAEIFDPAQTPAEWLPFLAVHEGVRFWFSDWPEARRRQIIHEWTELAALIGTRAAAKRFLAYVDAEIIHKVSYPATKPVGRIAVRLAPVQHPSFQARFLVKTALQVHRRAVCAGRTALGRATVIGVDRERLRRAKQALAISKAPDTAYTVSFAHRIPRTLDDGYDLDGSIVLGEFRDRHRL